MIIDFKKSDENHDTIIAQNIKNKRKNMLNKKPIYFTISFLCTICLFALYIFTNHADSFNNAPTSNNPSYTTENSNRFSFDPEVLTYDGNGALNYVEGVSYNNKPAPENISYIIKSTDAIDTKTIIYRIQLDDSIETASRVLQLVNYHTPKIIIPEPISSVDKDNLDDLYSILDYNKVSVDNGFGQEDKNRLKFEYNWNSTDSAQIDYTLHYINMCGDIATTSFSTEIQGYNYRIILSQDKISLKQFSNFNAKDYLISCTNQENIDSSKYVEIYDNVDTSKKGTYTVIYKLEEVNLKMIVEVN